MVTAPALDTLNLLVQRYEILAPAHTISPVSEHQALRAAASRAENILYTDIWGALELDLIKGWGKSGPQYPQPAVHTDNWSTWQSAWHIPPHEYENGVRWKPCDGMQQFDVKAIATKTGEGYVGSIELVAYVWDDAHETGKDRTGCLLDIVNRNKDRIVTAKGATIPIPMLKNTKQDIDNASLGNYGGNPALFGFEFPPNEIGDVSYTKFVFSPIDIGRVVEDCQFRDR